MAELREKFTAAFRDVRTKRIQYYLDESSQVVPGKLTELEWKDYCPDVFRNIQEMNSVNHADYMMLLCANNILREVSLPGKAGRVFVLSTNDHIVIKTLKKSELKVILDALPNYYFHMMKYPSSVILTLYGLHSVRQVGGLKVYFVVFANPIPLDMNIHDVYNLKGSSKGRTVQKQVIEEYTIHKDADFDYCFYIKPSIRERFLAQIKSDCEFLEEEGIIEYSLLIGLSMQTPFQGSLNGRSFHCVSTGCSSSTDTVDSRSSNSDTNSISSLLEFENTRLSSVICQVPDSGEFKFGSAMPARAVRKRMPETENAKEPESIKVVLYFAVVDIYQRYTMIKRFEHLYKSLHHDPKLISAVNCKDYSSRFQNYLEQIFLPENSDS
ncbi:hypothetical protein P3X46_014830 [Hevea brasiliensis]|uniref:1-phosphatidylinositol-4-phosphate 5-kinase n=1 Tax=Hevea brasiliensis TaxID=3981 RepID=A0ABQ9LVX0_HEVBR|nr:putative phosphatidylinositol 4-phosphate 5-kinase 11 [Hevea brasiliensis]KAJ9171463.1 hypothetical protein P3X46_014830 [Hevea brasiliensis]